MIPNNGAFKDYEILKNSDIPSKTFKIKGNRIVGMVDGVDAMKQAVDLILKTERYKYAIYSHDYGIERFENVDDEDLFKSEAKRLITEALTADTRIIDVRDFGFEKIDSRSLLVKFEVQTLHGDIESETEVQLNV